MDIVWFLPLNHLWLPLLALGLDLLLGDPRGLPHPVNLIGRLLNLLQKPLLRLKKYQRTGGVLALLCALLLSGLAAFALLNIADLSGLAVLALLKLGIFTDLLTYSLVNSGALSGFAGQLGGIISALAALYLAWAGLALGCLLREGEKARQALLRLDFMLGKAEAGGPAHKAKVQAVLEEARQIEAGGQAHKVKVQAALEEARQIEAGGPADQVEAGGQACKMEAQAALEEARHAVGMLVSRDVSRQDSAALYRTLAETLSENFNDAFVAPFFWLLLGGPVGLWVYKCASTADSRWGYKHEPWTRTGWAAARLDDLLAWIPARISAALLVLTWREFWVGRALYGLPCRQDGGIALSRAERVESEPEFSSGAANSATASARTGNAGRALIWRLIQCDAAKMESPNAGWSMAAAAWLHGAAMGGPAVYAGKLKMKPWLGPEAPAGRVSEVVESGAGVWDARRIASLLRHLRRAGLLGGVLMTALLALLRQWL